MLPGVGNSGPTIWTIGHSTRPLQEFLQLVASYRLEAVADVRRFPGSLSETLAEHRIDYRWLPALGGRRRPLPDSPNTAWRNASFRGYADHIASAEFSTGLDELLAISIHKRTALMCAESMWWRCHRALIAHRSGKAELCARGSALRTSNFQRAKIAAILERNTGNSCRSKLEWR